MECGVFLPCLFIIDLQPVSTAAISLEPSHSCRWLMKKRGTPFGRTGKKVGSDARDLAGNRTRSVSPNEKTFGTSLMGQRNNRTWRSGHKKDVNFIGCNSFSVILSKWIQYLAVNHFYRFGSLTAQRALKSKALEYIFQLVLHLLI